MIILNVGRDAKLSTNIASCLLASHLTLPHTMLELKQQTAFTAAI